MTRFSLVLATALHVLPSAIAQAQGPFGTSPLGSPQALEPERILSQVRDAGIYHLASNTWTRRTGAAASFGPDIIYSNTAPSGYFTSAGAMGGFAPGSRVYDEGNVPGTSNPTTRATAMPTR